MKINTLNEFLELDGAICAAVVDSNTGMILGTAGNDANLELAAAGNTEVVRAKLKTMKALKMDDQIEDILITLGKQYHILRPIHSREGLFIFAILDKAKSNLALARIKIREIDAAI